MPLIMEEHMSEQERAVLREMAVSASDFLLLKARSSHRYMHVGRLSVCGDYGCAGNRDAAEAIRVLLLRATGIDLAPAPAVSCCGENA